MNIPSHLEGLNPEQLEAVTTTEGPLLILAGAGSGKTRVLTRRIAHLLHLGVTPWSILAVTFTNKAAGEMKSRVQELVGDRARDVLVSTFHSACARFLRRDAPLLGYESSFVIYDDDDQVRLVRAILKDLKVDPKRFPPKGYLSRFDKAKNRMETPQGLVRSGEWQLPGQMRIEEVWDAYQGALQSANALDFNDLLLKMVELLEGRPEVLARYRARFRYLLVDEYQDTNHVQYRLVKALGQASRNVAVVGDDDQSIYGFRGADINNILSFEKDFPEARVVLLERNYRSTSTILEAAGSMVERNQHRKPKKLWTDAEPGEPIQLIQGLDEDHQARLVVGEMRRLMARGVPPGDMAVFYRTHAWSRHLEQALTMDDIPYVVVGSRRFYERREIRDMVAFMRLILNPGDDMAFLRIVNVPTRGIGRKTVERVQARASEEGTSLIEATCRVGASDTSRSGRALTRFLQMFGGLREAADRLTIGDLVHHVAEETGYLPQLRAEDTVEAQGRIENIDALASMAHEVTARLVEDTTSQERLAAFLDQASLTGQDEELPDESGRVTLMTVHLAKGLEFPVVFVVGMVDDVFPHIRSQGVTEEFEEERRLAYVAFTRARKTLYLCRPTTRLVRTTEGFMKAVVSRASPFLYEIPARLVAGGELALEDAPARRRAPIPDDAIKRMDAFLASLKAPPPPPPKRDTSQTMMPEDPDMFEVGTRVRHPRFGEGVILAKQGQGPSAKVVVEFRPGLKRLLRVREGRLEVFLD